ncbi:MAG: glycosyltransferase family 1 protein [Ktedonobacteraceae bacterium]|nr:glycosyltransferase family 4 protein [Chloroflexota bacterium]
MHIGINAQLLSFSQNYRNGGVSRYIRSLLEELARQPGEHEYTVFVNGQGVVEQLVAQHPQITYVPIAWREERPTTRVAWEQLSLPALIRQRKIDVLHSPVNVQPERLPHTCAGVVTLPDLAFLRFPHVLTRAKRLYHRTFTVHSLRRATMIISLSESTKRDAVELVGVPAERIQTVYPCIDARFTRSWDEEALRAFREKQGLEQGFILYLGTLEPRKNIDTLVEAYARLRQAYTIQEKLVLAGGKGWLYDAIFEKVQGLGLESEVLFPGYVADADQSLWYHAAAAFAYPSLYEGFGLPVAEALVSGVPVVTSNVSSLPEAGAGVALTVDPHNVEALAEALHKALTEEEFRQRCKVMAPVVAQQFSAQSMGEQTRAVYERAAERRGSRSRSQRIVSVR